MKKLILFLTLSSVLLFCSGCKIERIDINSETKNQCKQILDYLSSNDSEGLKDLFCKTVSSESDFDNQLSESLEFFDGSVVSYDIRSTGANERIVDGKQSEIHISPHICDIKTDTPIFVWLVINVYVLIFSKFLSPLSGLIVDILPSSLPWVLAITLLINAFAQVAIVSLTTIVAIRKFSYKIKCLTFSIPIMYLLFLLYNQPFVYIFVNTNEKSVFLDYTPAMPFWKASIFTTVQYGIVMLITTLITCRKKGADNQIAR